MTQIIKWNCDCGRSMRARVSGARSIVRRTCAGCRLVWAADLDAGRAQIVGRSFQRWIGLSDTGSEACAGTAQDLNLETLDPDLEYLGSDRRFFAVCLSHGNLFGADTWREAKQKAKETGSWCAVCCGDMTEGSKGDLGEMDQQWAIELGPWFAKN